MLKHERKIYVPRKIIAINTSQGLKLSEVARYISTTNLCSRNEEKIFTRGLIGIQAPGVKENFCT